MFVILNKQITNKYSQLQNFNWQKELEMQI